MMTLQALGILTRRELAYRIDIHFFLSPPLDGEIYLADQEGNRTTIHAFSWGSTANCRELSTVFDAH
jgi:hypothetical protein